MIYVLVGDSCSGKDTILKELLNRDKSLKKLISTTTRPKRENEVAGTDYNFISKEEFLKLLDDGGFIEFREYKSSSGDIWYYGTERNDSIDLSKDYICIKDVMGAKALKHEYGANAEVLWVNAPISIRAQRAMLRDDYNPAEWKNRVKSDKKIFTRKNLSSCCSTIISNDGDLNKVTNLMLDIINLRKGKVYPSGSHWFNLLDATNGNAGEAMGKMIGS